VKPPFGQGVDVTLVLRRTKKHKITHRRRENHTNTKDDISPVEEGMTSEDYFFLLIFSDFTARFIFGFFFGHDSDPGSSHHRGLAAPPSPFRQAGRLHRCAP